MDPSPAGPAQGERCRLPNHGHPELPSPSQPFADPTSPKPFPRLWAGLWFCCNLRILPGCSLFLGKQMTAARQEQERR